MKKRYDFVFSLGQACSCTENLRKAKLQVLSYPFDWLYGTSLEARIGLLVNDFRDWFRKDDFEFDSDKPGSKFHVYRNVRTGLIFNHDFPRSDDFTTGYGKVCARYKRRTARLIKKIEASAKVLAVYVEQPYARDFVPDHKLIYCKDRLNSRFRDSTVDLLYVHRGDSRDARWRTIANGVTTLSLDYRSTAPDALDYQVDRILLSNAMKSRIGLTIAARIKWLATKMMRRR